MPPQQAPSSDHKYFSSDFQLCGSRGSISLSKSSWIQRLIPSQKMKLENPFPRCEEDMWISRNPEVSLPVAADGSSGTLVYENSRKSITTFSRNEQNPQVDTVLKSYTGISMLPHETISPTSELQVSPMPLPLIESLLKGERRNINEIKASLDSKKTSFQRALASPFSNMRDAAAYPPVKNHTLNQHTKKKCFQADLAKKTVDIGSSSNSIRTPPSTGEGIIRKRFGESDGGIKHIHSRKMQKDFTQERWGCAAFSNKVDTCVPIKEDMLQQSMHENSVTKQDRTEARKAFHDFFKMGSEFGVRFMEGSGIQGHGFGGCGSRSTLDSKVLQNISAAFDIDSKFSEDISANASGTIKGNLPNSSISALENFCQDSSKQLGGITSNVASDRIQDESTGPSNNSKPVGDSKVWLQRFVSPSKRKSYDQLCTNAEMETITEFHWDMTDGRNSLSKFSELRSLKRKHCEDTHQQSQCAYGFSPHFKKSAFTPSAGALAVIGTTARQVHAAQSMSKGFFGAWAASISSSSRVHGIIEPRAQIETLGDLKKAVAKPQKVSPFYLERVSDMVDA